MAVKRIVVTGDPATCGDPATGSGDCTINNLGISRTGVDIAGAPIIGPGATTLFVNGSPASLESDLVVSHGLPPHLVPLTVAAQNTSVFAGDGFAGGGVGLTDADLSGLGLSLDDLLGGIGGGVSFGTKRIDLNLVSWEPVQSNISVSQPGDPCYIPKNNFIGNFLDDLGVGGGNVMNVPNRDSILKTSCHGPLEFNYVIANSDTVDSPAFKCKVFEVPIAGLSWTFTSNSNGILTNPSADSTDADPVKHLNFPDDSFPYSKAEWEFTVPPIPAGGSFSGTVGITEYRHQKAYWKKSSNFFDDLGDFFGGIFGGFFNFIFGALGDTGLGQLAGNLGLGAGNQVLNYLFGNVEFKPYKRFYWLQIDPDNQVTEVTEQQYIGDGPGANIIDAV